MTLNRQATAALYRRCGRLCIALAAVWVAGTLPAGRAPAQEVPVGISAPDTFRLTFFAYDQMAYTTHPFFQITGDGDYEGANGGVGATWVVDPPQTDAEASGLERTLHSLPSFAVEWGWGTDLGFPAGISVGVDYSRLGLTDNQALSGKSGVEVPRIQMDSYLYTVPFRFFVFDPAEPGINYFFGVALGGLSGRIAAGSSTVSGDTEYVRFNQWPYGSTRVGLEALGESFGFRYEMRLVNANEVKLNRNPYIGQERTTIDFSGTLLRFSLFLQFGGGAAAGGG